MKSNDIKDLHQQTVADLRKQLVGLQQHVAMLRMKKAAGKPEKELPSRVSDDVARIKTVIREKELLAVVEAAAEKEAMVKAPTADKKETKKETKVTKKTVTKTKTETAGKK
jgi:ribosomal protein L29